MGEWKYGDILRRYTTKENFDRALGSAEERVMFICVTEASPPDEIGFVALVLAGPSNDVKAGDISHNNWSHWWQAADD